MAGKKKDVTDPPNPLGWMVTFSDLVTLLLTFFVLLISMSSMDVKSMEQAFGVFFSGGSGVLEFAESGQLEDLAKMVSTLDQPPGSVSINLQDLKEAVFQFEDQEFQSLMALADQDVTILEEERGLVVRLTEGILFTEGGAEIQREYAPILSKIANLLRVSRRPISVEGHTGRSVLEGADQTWAWELSLERALAVMRFFVDEEGVAEDRFRVGGFGPSQPLPGTDWNDPESAAKNRRIEIVLYRPNRG